MGKYIKVKTGIELIRKRKTKPVNIEKINLPGIFKYKKYSNKTKKILVQFPTKQRKKKFFKVLDIYYSMLKDIDNIWFHIVIDEDDKEMCNVDFSKYKNLTVTKGKHNSKINAINDLTGVNLDNFDIILLASDDMIPQIKGYDNIIREKMQEFYPFNNGVLWFFDGYRKDLNTLCILGVDYYKRFNYIYNPNYLSWYCDDEFMQVASILGKQTYIDKCIIKHEHQCWTGEPKDKLYKYNDSFAKVDKKTFLKRKKNNFDLNNLKEEILWEILICTIDERKELFNTLITKLSNQINQLNLSDKIKISFLRDNKEITIGKKRNKLMQNALGKYISSIDDDDDISDDYIYLIYNALLKDPDCIGMTGILFDSGNQKIFIHSLKYRRYYEKDNVYYRPPNHLNPMKRIIVKQVLFENKNHGEDTIWALRINKKKILKNEIFIDKPIYFYNQ